MAITIWLQLYGAVNKMTSLNRQTQMIARVAPLVLLTCFSACAPGEPFGLIGGYDLVPHQTIGSFSAGPGLTGELRRNTLDGSLSVDIPNSTGHLALPQFTDASIVRTWRDGGQSVAVIRGSSPSCAVSYQVVTLQPGTITWTNPFGNCVSNFSIEERNGKLYFTQNTARDPEMYRYGADMLAGPKLRSTLSVMEGGQVTGNNRPIQNFQTRTVTSHVNTPTRPSTFQAAPRFNSTPAYSSTPEPVDETPVSAAPPPRRLRPVGEDDMPSIVPVPDPGPRDHTPAFDPE